MELPPNESSQPAIMNSSDEVPHDERSPVSDVVDANGGAEPVHEVPVDQAISMLQAMASTGKFWHDWDDLKNMLSSQLKQVLSEYPEAKMNPDEVKSSLGETYEEMVKRLDEALLGFSDGPPFTLQRLCEILLDARGIYRNLSKLALALEKTLLVTTTLTKSAEPHPLNTTDQLEVPNEDGKDAQPHYSPVENGGEALKEDIDEIMTEVEETEAGEDMTIDTKTAEDTVTPSEPNTEQTNT